MMDGAEKHQSCTNKQKGKQRVSTRTHTRARARATHLGALDGVGVGVLDVARGAGAAVVLVALLSIKAPAPPPPTRTFVLHAGPLTWSKTRVGGGVPGLLYQHAGANLDHRCAFESLHAPGGPSEYESQYPNST